MNKKGFTFVELLVVITIIAVIFSAGVVSYTEVTKKSRDARRKADVENIRSALELCRSNFGYYPADIGTNVACGTAIYLTKTPTDPQTDDPYVYVPDAAPQAYSYTITATLESGEEETYQLTNP